MTAWQYRVIRRSAMAELNRINICNATLFPGLDGLARSLAYELETRWASIQSR